jgi:hypothetical protein
MLGRRDEQQLPDGDTQGRQEARVRAPRVTMPFGDSLSGSASGVEARSLEGTLFT